MTRLSVAFATALSVQDANSFSRTFDIGIFGLGPNSGPSGEAFSGVIECDVQRLSPPAATSPGEARADPTR